MAEERFPEQHEQERAGGQHGTRNTDGARAKRDARERELSKDQPSEDPQLKRVRENVESGQLPNRNDVDVKDGGARQRQQ